MPTNANFRASYSVNPVSLDKTQYKAYNTYTCQVQV